MNRRFRFDIENRDPTRPGLPEVAHIGARSTETETHVALKFLGFLLFYEPGLEIEQKIQDPSNPYTPDLVAREADGTITFWGECGHCNARKLTRLAVKAPEARIGVLKKSVAEARSALSELHKLNAKKDRYEILAFEKAAFHRLLESIQPRNTCVWFGASIEPPQLKFHLNAADFTQSLFLERY